MSTRALNASAWLRAGILVPALSLICACSQAGDEPTNEGGSTPADSPAGGAVDNGGTSSNDPGASGGDTDPGSDEGSTGGDNAGAVTSCDSLNPLEILGQFVPADEELAESYEEYITTEVGPLSCATQGTGTARKITQTIFVPPNTVYDGKGEKLTADVAAMKCDTSKGEQGESQRPFFLLAPGASVKNVTITYPGCEGIHMMGDNALENITWEDVGEDAASVRSYFPGGKITIKNSKGFKAADKMFQFNAPCDVRIESFTGAEMGKLLRQNGGTDFELKVDLDTVTVTGVISAVVQSDSPLCFVKHHNLKYQFTGSGDKSDRVFKGIPVENVTEY
ncbi:pectate lyase [Polyangium aurulentum]|uniref:pectate lyase n=1 Tax=Polyangium aurulentum TaxID=2567896 RepID=UPI0010ADC271|nr:pectate lyase [Polyangium aurulentum]UQA59865.1 pectate lyase [Polyangium aurulentum]